MIQIIILSVITLINIILWIILFVQLNKKFSSKNILKSIHGEINELVAEMNRETDRDISLLEARREGLLTLIEEAEKKTRLAQKEINKKNVEEKVLKELSEITPKKESKRAVSPKDQKELFEINLAQNYQKKDLSMPVITAAKEQIEIKKPLRVQIIELSNDGLSPDLISEKLHISITEVQMVIDLFC